MWFSINVSSTYNKKLFFCEKGFWSWVAKITIKIAKQSFIRKIIISFTTRRRHDFTLSENLWPVKENFLNFLHVFRLQLKRTKICQVGKEFNFVETLNLEIQKLSDLFYFILKLLKKLTLKRYSMEIPKKFNIFYQGIRHLNIWHLWLDSQKLLSN